MKVDVLTFAIRTYSTDGGEWYAKTYYALGVNERVYQWKTNLTMIVESRLPHLLLIDSDRICKFEERLLDASIIDNNYWLDLCSLRQWEIHYSYKNIEFYPVKHKQHLVEDARSVGSYAENVDRNRMFAFIKKKGLP